MQKQLYQQLWLGKLCGQISSCRSANKLVYTKLISTKCTHLTHNQQKWLKDCHQNDVDSINWRDAYQLASKYSYSTSIHEFQYKAWHRRIATNDFLTKIGVRDNSNCSFCNGKYEELLHFFWSCRKVESFWHDLTVRLPRVPEVFSLVGGDRTEQEDLWHPGYRKANFAPNYSWTLHNRPTCRSRFKARFFQEPSAN